MSGVDEQGVPQCRKCLANGFKTKYWIFEKNDRRREMWKTVGFLDLKVVSKKCSIMREYLNTHVVFPYSLTKPSIEDYTLDEVERVKCQSRHVNKDEFSRLLGIAKRYVAQEGIRVI